MGNPPLSDICYIYALFGYKNSQVDIMRWILVLTDFYIQSSIKQMLTKLRNTINILKLQRKYGSQQKHYPWHMIKNRGVNNV